MTSETSLRTNFSINSNAQILLWVQSDRERQRTTETNTETDTWIHFLFRLHSWLLESITASSSSSSLLLSSVDERDARCYTSALIWVTDHDCRRLKGKWLSLWFLIFRALLANSKSCDVIINCLLTEVKRSRCENADAAEAQKDRRLFVNKT